MKNLKITLAQIKLITGDLEFNYNQILKSINKATVDGSNILVLPELSTTAYNCGFLFNQIHFIEYQLKFLNEKIIPAIPKDLIVIVGYVRLIGKHFDGTPEIANSAMVVQNGKILGLYDKILLANGGHHEDKKYFTPGTIPSPISTFLDGKEIKIGVVICEDIFSVDHRRNIPKEIVNNGAEIIISLNQSYFAYDKIQLRHNLCKNHAKNLGVPFVYVNSFGVGDIQKNFFLYDGGSFIIDSSGEYFGGCEQFKEEIKTLDLIYEKSYAKYKNKNEQIFDALVCSQKEIFKDLGFKKAIVAVSGGLDSSVTLPIVVEAMGAENVYALSMPSKYNSDLTKSNAQKLCDSLGVKLYWMPLPGVQQSFIDAFKQTFEVEPALLNISTFDAVGRTVAGIASSQHLKAGLVSTSNHTETVLNWFSWHDISTAAVYAPLADMSKVEIFQMADFINKKHNKEIVPLNLFDGTTEPGPELADAAHAKWNYFVVSGICSMLIRWRMDVKQIVQAYKNNELTSDFFPLNPKGESIYDLVPSAKEFEEWAWMCFERQKQSVYKTNQAAPPLIISPLSRGFSNRETIINHYTGEYKFQQKELI